MMNGFQNVAIENRMLHSCTLWIIICLLVGGILRKSPELFDVWLNVVYLDVIYSFILIHTQSLLRIMKS
jgi:hypothetical protein